MAENPAFQQRPSPVDIVIQDENGGVVKPEEGSEYTKQTKKLRRVLKWYFYAALKFKNKTCFIHVVYLAIFFTQVVKVALITTQMFSFGHDRGNFSSTVNRGHLALRHLLLKGWDASWETLPYPPAQGDFALYIVEDLTEAIDFAVERYFNAEKDAIGFYVRLPMDDMVAQIKYFDFPGFSDDKVKSGIDIHTKTFPIKHGLSETIDPKTKEVSYNYSISREFEFLKLTQPIKKMLLTTLTFQLHSVRVYEKDAKARCLRIKGDISFQDLDNNGQVNVDLETLTSRIKCADMNFASLPDLALDNTSNAVAVAVIAFSVISVLLTLASMICGIVLFLRTKGYMKVYYQKFYNPLANGESDLPWREYTKFFKPWDLLVIIGDGLTLFGTVWIRFIGESINWVLATLDSYTVWLGIGCLLAWVSLLRFFKFHNKFHLLFSTLYRAFWDVMAYLLCITVLFMGFWVCGFVVMGPYHVKFQTPEAAMETLFAIVNGDEIFATMAILESKKSGDSIIFWFSRFYIGLYVAIFTVVVINLLIAIFMSAYEEITEYYKTAPEERDLGPMEQALRKFLRTNTERNSLRSSIYDLLNDEGSHSTAEMPLKRELSKLVRISESKKDVVLFRPTTLKAFMEDEEDVGLAMDCGCFKCVLVLLGSTKVNYRI
ncbi:MCLN1-like protein [Mya arenaria]|uniref:MCLN1-like protein n=1 Tax=Mya arenaria TaxID=6604 RepID=A0ABY7FT82_MYAAR|nr:mucolipin-1-like isoform X2 [Mya arenaria]XP_052780388.1 mucolipin-1-like isoform X2 [Mya arenaria]XP_052780389.1 mucolipin-1-like isoform X2 [Mya arenaria]XP_052780390.1 mucolipin-1-like isoform X2 [Mya arenaria]WAR25215.1 MCLN1-like protein [Mya arenaria]